MLGAGNIIAVDLSDYRLQFARRLGADHVINASDTTLAERLEFVRGFSHGRGADMVIGSAGVPQAMPEALDMMRLGGLLVEAGNFSDLGEVASARIATSAPRAREFLEWEEKSPPLTGRACGKWLATCVIIRCANLSPIAIPFVT